MSETPAATPAAEPAPAPPEITPEEARAALFGTREQIQEALGLPPEPSDKSAADPEPAAEPAKEAKEPEAPTDEEAARVAELRAINLRSRQRRQAREAARRGPQPAPAAPAPEAKVNGTNGTAKPSSVVTTAVKDVLDQIARLAGEDEAKGGATTTPETQARAGELAAIRAQVETLAKMVTTDQEGLKAQVAEMRAALQAADDANFVRAHIVRKVDAIEDELPILSARPDGIDVIHAAAEKFFDKYHVPPNMQELARRIEAKLSAKNGTAEGPRERAATRKTVSTNSHGSPPAARSGPDKRSADEALAEFNARFGLDQ